MIVNELFGSKVRTATAISLAKSSLYDMPVTPLRVIKTYGLNIPETYKFFKLLKEARIVEKVRGGYKLTNSSRALKFRNFVLDLLEDLKAGENLDVLRTRVPDTSYYVVDTSRYFREWFGVAETLVVVDERLKGRIKVPDARLVFAPLKKREFRYDWNENLSYALCEQAFADIFSYDPNYSSYFIDVLWNVGRLDLDKVMELASSEGKKRLGTLLAYYSMLTGRKIPLKFSCMTLVDEKYVDEVVAVATSLIMPNDLMTSRNI